MNCLEQVKPELPKTITCTMFTLTICDAKGYQLTVQELSMNYL